MEVIPVLDLKQGTVVRARMGQRGQYRPITTPLASTSNPIDVACGLLSIYAFRTFYIADLDAIAGSGDNNAALMHLKVEFPNLTFWVDNGIADWASAQRWLDASLGHLVLGSETQKDELLVRELSRDDRIILSLDYRGDAFVGPEALLKNVDAWPNRVITMTLARVGSAMGPDWSRLAAIKCSGRGRCIYAAGGVRDAADLIALADRGIVGALVASSLHNGTLAGAQIARLQMAVNLTPFSPSSDGRWEFEPSLSGRRVTRRRTDV
jgi:phosphoribosylformimino-5-aminoimidazole carboxamide ribotide isomerase